MAIDLAPRVLICFFLPTVPELPGTSPPPLLRRVHCQSFTQFVHTVASLPPTPGKDYAYQQPCNDPSAYAYTHSAPRDFAGDQQGIYPTAPTSHLGVEGGGARVAQVYPRPQDFVPQGMAPTGCHYWIPAPIATQPVSTHRYPSPGLVTGTLVLRTCAIMGSRAGKTSCTSSLGSCAASNGPKWSNMTSSASRWRAWLASTIPCCSRLTPGFTWGHPGENLKTALGHQRLT